MISRAARGGRSAHDPQHQSCADTPAKHIAPALVPGMALLLATVPASMPALSAANDSQAPHGYALYERQPLGGRVSGIVAMECSSSCTTRRATLELPEPLGVVGSLEVWQDSRITASTRVELQAGRTASLAFAGGEPRNALILLKDASGASVARSEVEGPLIELDPLLLGLSTPAYLISVTHITHAIPPVVIGKGILDVDLRKRQLALATFSGPSNVRVTLPDGEISALAVPGDPRVITFGSSFSLLTDPSAHTARLTARSCVLSSYVDYRTRPSIEATMTVRVTYELVSDVWYRRADLEFADCGAAFTPAPERLQSRN